MGSWFSNFHIRQSAGVTAERIGSCLSSQMTARDYQIAGSAEEADCAIALVSGGEWVSVYSDAITFEHPKDFLPFAHPLSAELNADVLGISCYDSDYLYLYLINAAENVDAWAGVGSARGLGIYRRTNLRAWKGKIKDEPAFRTAVKTPRILAEDVLAEIEPCIGLPFDRASGSLEHLHDLELADQAQYLYFKLPPTAQTGEPPRLEQHTWTNMPCAIGEPTVVQAVNMGGASRGLSIYFVGPFVEHDELTFTDVCLLKEQDGRFVPTPIELEKVQLSDGQWAYRYFDPNYRIQEKVDRRLPLRKGLSEESKRSIMVRFVPQGNRRKLLDVSVVIVPEQNYAGQTGWNVWRAYGSKAAFIEHHNSLRCGHPGCEHQLLKLEDFD